MLFSENRFPLFRIMLYQAGLEIFAGTFSSTAIDASAVAVKRPP
jgi:hypothetical protein